MLWGVHKIRWQSQAVLESLEEGLIQGNATEPLRGDVLWEVRWFGKAGWEVVWKIKGPAGLRGPIRWGRLLSAAVLTPATWDSLAQEMWCPFLSHPAGYRLWWESRARPGLVLLHNVWWGISAARYSAREESCRGGCNEKAFRRATEKVEIGSFHKTCWKLLERQYEWRGWKATKIVVIKSRGQVGG